MSATRGLILIPLLLLVLVGLFLLLRPDPPAAKLQERAFDLRIRGDAMTPDEITVNEGDMVMLRINSHEPAEFHLHGYDIEREVEAGESTEVAFEADASGRFEIEVHAQHEGGGQHADEGEDGHSHEASGTLTVKPR